MADQVSVTQEIGAPAEKVWAMVSDLTRMGEWSPENEGSTWLRGATGPQQGATFRGANRNGKKKWTTLGEITDVEPGRLLAFRITAAGFKVAEWRYEFETTATGCRITETWIDQRGRIAKAIGTPVSGVKDRAAHNRATMEKTLERLKSTAESSPASTS
jgi:uncharacterized protein YndB with AHSA1/START domain